MFGHRPEGSRVRDVDPIVQITPYLMPMRCDAQVFLDYDVEYEPLMRYIAKRPGRRKNHLYGNPHRAPASCAACRRCRK